MIDFNIEDLVRQYVIFRHGVASQGWNVTYCEYCGDGSRTKGPRGGWMFSDGGETAFYHCFNCGCNESFSTQREYPFSKNMPKVFDSFGIPSKDVNAIVLKSKNNGKKQKNSISATMQSVVHKVIEIPDHFSFLKDCSDDGAKLAKSFLKKNYGLTTKHYSFMYGSGVTSSTDIKTKAEAKSLAGRLIIPYFKSGGMIYYQARDVTGASKLKYISPEIPKSSILFNIDMLYVNTDAPLYVTEGALDAIHLNGIAVLGNEISSKQRDMLKSSRRRKILVPDFNGDSAKLCEQFIENGWEVSFPEYRTSCKDVSESVIKYGKLYTANDIVTNIKSNAEAKMLITFMNVS